MPDVNELLGSVTTTLENLNEQLLRLETNLELRAARLEAASDGAPPAALPVLRRQRLHLVDEKDGA